jgi:hypothetical protein
MVPSDLCPIQCCTVRTSNPHAALASRTWIGKSNFRAYPGALRDILTAQKHVLFRVSLGEGKTNKLDAAWGGPEANSPVHSDWNLSFLPSLRVKAPIWFCGNADRS